MIYDGAIIINLNDTFSNLKQAIDCFLHKFTFDHGLTKVITSSNCNHTKFGSKFMDEPRWIYINQSFILMGLHIIKMKA